LGFPSMKYSANFSVKGITDVDPAILITCFLLRESTDDLSAHDKISAATINNTMRENRSINLFLLVVL
jgi:hypothetical protein